MFPADCKTIQHNIDEAGVRTLIVDDSEMVLSSVRSYLEDVSGITVVATATNGKEAIDQVRLHQPQLVLLDLHMPGMNGFDAASRITQEFPATRVVHISACGGYEYERASQQSGAQFLLSKSKLPAQFPAVLQRLFGARKTLAQPLHVHA